MTCETKQCQNRATFKVWDNGAYIYCCESCKAKYETITSYTVEFLVKKKSKTK